MRHEFTDMFLSFLRTTYFYKHSVARLKLIAELTLEAPLLRSKFLSEILKPSVLRTLVDRPRVHQEQPTPVLALNRPDLRELQVIDFVELSTPLTSDYAQYTSILSTTASDTANQ